MEDAIIPYELPEVENHSFFFIDQQVEVNLEAKLHQHDAWELYYVVHGQGNRMAGVRQWEISYNLLQQATWC